MMLGMPGDKGRSRRRPLLGAAVLALVLVAMSATAALAGGGAPTVETEKASPVGRTSAVLNASVNPNGSAVSECYFEYGSSESSLTGTAQCTYSPGAGETPVPVYADLEALPESTPYFFRIHARSSAGTSTGSIDEVTTLPTAPKSNTMQAKPIGHTTATFNATITPNDAEVSECFFEYGTASDELDNQVSCAQAPGAGSEPVVVSAVVTDLQESTVYYYRVVARNSFASEQGGRTKFETLPSAPKVNAEAAHPIARTTATLKGSVTPNDVPIEACYFQWGAHSVEEHTVPCEPAALGSGEEAVTVTAQLTGLKESETYDYRLVASSARGTTTSSEPHFTTLPYAPKVDLRKPTELTAESALLKGAVNPEGAAVSECTFEYGTTPALGQSAPCSTLPGAVEGDVRVSAPVSGLSATTTYVERLKVRNAFGVVYSGTENFTTFKSGEPPVVKKLKPTKGHSTGGTVVTIKGEYLSGATAVTFGEAETTDITQDSPDSLTVISPPGAGTVDVTVTTANGESATSSADRFAYGAPTVTSVSPNSGPKTGGTEVTITGTGFEPGSSTTRFLFAKAAATSVECASTQTCNAIVPPSLKGRLGTVAVVAVVNGKKSPANTSFQYTT
jgi:hypothetical protein